MIEYLPAALPVLGGVVWAVRLEAKANGAVEKYKLLREDVQRVESKVDHLIEMLLRK